MSLYLLPKSLADENNADYVQLIDTKLVYLGRESPKLSIIKVDAKCKGLLDSTLAKRIYELTATKALIMIASTNGYGRILKSSTLPELERDESLVGIHNKDHKKGMFHITVTEQFCAQFQEQH